MSNIMEQVEPLARKIEVLDEEISRIKHELEEKTSERESASNEAIAILQENGIETSLGLSGGGTVKIETSIYPSIKDFDGFVKWSVDNAVDIPPVTINANTMRGWYREQLENSKLLPPPEIVSAFPKSKIKVLKK